MTALIMYARRRGHLAALALVAVFALTPIVSVRGASGTWTRTGSMSSARYQWDNTQGRAAERLQDGRVLMVANDVDDLLGVIGTSEVFNPATGTWAATGSLNTPRSVVTTFLSSGKVLVEGGVDSFGNIFASAELYDPATGRWSTTGSLITARDGHSATLLSDGRVLVAGGTGSSGVLSSAEMYNPATGAWSAAGNMLTARAYASALRLQDGRVLVVGGDGGDPTQPPLTSAEIFDPAIGRWSATGSTVTLQSFPTTTVLGSGKVLLVGGLDLLGNTLATAELFDPTTGVWSVTGRMATARVLHSAALLGNGKVLVAGGENSTGQSRTVFASAELFDPATGLFSTTGSMQTTRAEFQMIPLANGQVLVAGGDTGSSQVTPTTAAELYTP